MADKGGEYYRVLGVSPKARQEEIRHAFRRLAGKYHPDLGGGPEAERMMLRINEAYSALKDPGRRKLYDEQVSTRAQKEGRPGAGQPDSRFFVFSPEEIARKNRLVPDSVALKQVSSPGWFDKALQGGGLLKSHWIFFKVLKNLRASDVEQALKESVKKAGRGRGAGLVFRSTLVHLIFLPEQGLEPDAVKKLSALDGRGVTAYVFDYSRGKLVKTGGGRQGA